MSITRYIQRDWATPLTAGAFGLLAVTGVLMFFHLDSGLNKVAHEWLGWVLLAGAGAHLAVNFAAFKRYLRMPRPRALLAGFALLLGLSFVPVGGGGEPPFVAPLARLAAAPLPVLAAVAGTDRATLVQRLAAAGLPGATEASSVASLAGPDRRRQVQVLGQVLAAR